MSRLAWILFGLALLPPPNVAAAPVPNTGAFRFTIVVSGQGLQIPYDANKSLSGSYAQVKRAVVLVPGSSRSSQFAYDTLLEAAAIGGANDAATLLVAPQFLIEEDILFHQLSAEHLFWSDSGWKQGNQSQSTVANPRPVAVSSFAVMDSILHRIGARNPNLQEIVLAGHSAGGQYVHRFAAGSDVEAALAAQFGVEVKYVPSNASSYLYLNAERAVPGTLNLFAIPPASTVQSCPDYDDYKYGLQAGNTYMSRLSRAVIMARFPQRRVSYLLGALDTDPMAADLDTVCAAMLQGSHRLERGKIFAFYSSHLYGSSVGQTQRTIIVPGVGHDSRDMFTSSCGVAELFGGGGCDPVDAGAEDGVAAGSTLALWNGRPNPFRARTTIAYRVPHEAVPVALRVYDARGRLVRTLDQGPAARGRAEIEWDGRSDAGFRAPAGVYFLRLQQGAESVTRRVTLLR